MDMVPVHESLLVDAWQSNITAQNLINDPPELTWAFPRSGHFYSGLQCLSFLLQWEKSQRSEITETKNQTFIIVEDGSSLGSGSEASSGSPSKIYEHLCKCLRGVGLVRGGHPTHVEVEFFLPFVFKTILLGTSWKKFQMFWNNTHSEHLLKI